MQNIGPCTEGREVPAITFHFTDHEVALRKRQALLDARYWVHGASIVICALILPHDILAALIIFAIIQGLFWGSVSFQRLLLACSYVVTSEGIQNISGVRKITLRWDEIQTMEFTGEYSEMELKSISTTMWISRRTPRFWDLHRLIAKLLISNATERQDVMNDPSDTIQNGDRPDSWRRVPWVEFED